MPAFAIFDLEALYEFILIFPQQKVCLHFDSFAIFYTENLTFWTKIYLAALLYRVLCLIAMETASHTKIL